MGLHSRSSHSVWIKLFNHKPFIVSSLQEPIVLTEDAQSAVPFTVFDPDIDFLVQSQSNIYLRAASKCCSLNLRLTCTRACYFTNSAHSVNMSNEVDLVGTPNELNGQLKPIVVKLTENYVGFTTLEASLLDKRLLSDLASFTVTAVEPITVTPINDPPVIQLPFATIRMDENAAAYVGDVAMKSYIQISDPDCLNVTADSMVYSIQLSSYAGSFTLLAGDGGPVLIDTFSNIFGLSTVFWAVDYSRNAQNSSLVINGTLHDLNMVLSGVMYQPEPTLSAKIESQYLRSIHNSLLRILKPSMCR
jgi:hypothetical protein